MPTYDLFVKASRLSPAPYAVTRMRCESGEVSHAVDAEAAFYPGHAPAVLRQWRWIRVTGAPEGLHEILPSPDLLHVEDLGKGFSARRKIRRVDLAAILLPSPRLVPDVDSPVWSAQERDGMLTFMPRLAAAPRQSRRTTRWDAIIAYSTGFFLRKPEEGRDASGYPRKEDNAIPDKGIDQEERL